MKDLSKTKVAGFPPYNVKGLHPDDIILGNRIRDKISGLQGIAVARVEYLNGNIQFAIQPKTTDNIKVPDTQYIDLIKLEYIDEGVLIDCDQKTIGFKI